MKKLLLYTRAAANGYRNDGNANYSTMMYANLGIHMILIGTPKRYLSSVLLKGEKMANNNHQGTSKRKPSMFQWRLR